MLLTTARTLRKALGPLALLAMCGAGPAQALQQTSCTPGVQFATVGGTLPASYTDPTTGQTVTGYGGAGFTLGCMSPGLWSVLSVQQQLGKDGNVTFTGTGSGTTPMTAGFGNVGAFGGSVTLDAGAKIKGDIVGTTGLWPSYEPTVVTAPGHTVAGGNLRYDDYLLSAARNDAYTALLALNSLAMLTSASATDGIQKIAGNVDSTMTFKAETDGLNVINITKAVELGTGEVLKFDTNSKTNVSFVINIGGDFKLTNAKVELVGADLAFSDVFFNVGNKVEFKDTDGNAALQSQEATGIVFALGGEVTFSNGLLQGMVIGGKDMTFGGDKPGSQVKNPGPYGCTFTAANPDIPTCIIYKAPEPGTAVLLAIGFLAALRMPRVFDRRRRSRAGVVV